MLLKIHNSCWIVKHADRISVFCFYIKSLKSNKKNRNTFKTGLQRFLLSGKKWIRTAVSRICYIIQQYISLLTVIDLSLGKLSKISLQLYFFMIYCTDILKIYTDLFGKNTAYHLEQPVYFGRITGFNESLIAHINSLI